MAHTIDSHVRPLWHDNVQAPGRAAIALPLRLRRILLVATFLLVALAAAAGLLTWLVGQPNVHFISCWVTQFRDPTIPPNTAADQDRLAILHGDFFAKTDIASMPVRSRYLIQQQLSAVAEKSDSESVVVYVGAYATVDARGHVVLLSSDFDPGNIDSGLPLVSVLQSLAKAKAKHKLLVLDIFSPCLQPGLSAAAADVAAAIPVELDSVQDHKRLVLCSCSPGQTALVSESMQRTVFGYYFQQAMCGAADGYNPSGLRDGRVSVREMAEMLRARVDRWAIHNTACRQTPQLLGIGEDFELTACDGLAPEAPVAGNLPKYPPWLLDSWKLRDRWVQDDTSRFAPRIFQTLEASLLRIEKKWRLGVPVQQLQTECQDKIADLQQLLSVAQQQLSGPRPTSLAAVVAAGHVANPQADAAVSQLLDSIQAAGAAKPDQQQAALQKFFADFDKQSKDISDTDLALSLLRAATSGAPLSTDRLHALSQLLQHRSNDGQWIETRVLNRLAARAQLEPPLLWPTSHATQLFRIVQQSEQAFCHSETMPWMSHLLEVTAQQSHNADVYFWSDRYVPSGTADDALAAALDACDNAVAHEEVLVKASRLYDTSMQVMPWYAQYVSRCPAETTLWTSAIDAAVNLGQLLEADVQPQGMSKQQLEAIQRTARDTATALNAVQQPFSSRAVQQLIGRCTNENAPANATSEIDAVLATPLLPADQRVALWTARTQLALKLHEHIMQVDFDEQLQGHRTAVLAGDDPDVAMRTATSLCIQRYRISLDLLRLGGFPTDRSLPELPDDDQNNLSSKDIASMTHLWNITLRDAIHDDQPPLGENV